MLSLQNFLTKNVIAVARFDMPEFKESFSFFGMSSGKPDYVLHFTCHPQTVALNIHDDYTIDPHVINCDFEGKITVNSGSGNIYSESLDLIAAKIINLEIKQDIKTQDIPAFTGLPHQWTTDRQSIVMSNEVSQSVNVEIDVSSAVGSTQYNQFCDIRVLNFRYEVG
jgi:hypothetical protein